MCVCLVLSDYVMIYSLVYYEEIVNYIFFFLFREYIPCIYLLNKIDQISIEVSIRETAARTYICIFCMLIFWFQYKFPIGFL